MVSVNFLIVCGHPLWKRNSVIYFFDGQSWMWINIWSILCDQPSRGVLEGSPRVSFQSNNKHSADLVYLAWKLKIHLTELIWCGQHPSWEVSGAFFTFGLNVIYFRCVRQYRCKNWNFPAVAVSWLVGDSREVSGCFPSYTRLHVDYTARLHRQQHVTNAHVPITARLHFLCSCIPTPILFVLKSMSFLGF